MCNALKPTGCETARRLAAAEERGKVLEAENARMTKALERLRDCDWVITPLDRMDAVREIARAALQKAPRDDE